MNRRTLLTRIGAVTAGVAIAGCLDDSAADAPGSDGEDDDTDNEDGDATENENSEDDGDGENDTDAEYDEGEEDVQSIADHRIETIGTASESDGETLTVVSEATVSFLEDTVEIHGTLQAPTPCFDAVFADVSLEYGHLSVIVELEEDEEADACVQVISEIEYEATISFELGVPESATVIHLDEQGEGTAAEATA